MASVQMLLGRLPAGVKTATVLKLNLVQDALMMMSVPWGPSSVIQMLNVITLMAHMNVNAEMASQVRYSQEIYICI